MPIYVGRSEGEWPSCLPTFEGKNRILQWWGGLTRALRPGGALPVARGGVQRRLPEVGLEVHYGPLLDERLHDGLVPVAGGGVEGRLAVVVLRRKDRQMPRQSTIRRSTDDDGETVRPC